MAVVVICPSCGRRVPPEQMGGGRCARCRSKEHRRKYGARKVPKVRKDDDDG